MKTMNAINHSEDDTKFNDSQLIQTEINKNNQPADTIKSIQIIFIRCHQMSLDFT